MSLRTLGQSRATAPSPHTMAPGVGKPGVAGGSNRTLIAAAVLSWLVAIVPYRAQWTFGYGVHHTLIDVGTLISWCAIVGGAWRLCRGSSYRWVLLLAAPLAIWPVLRTPLVFLIWRLDGFAP
jgi:hypothetical protein